MQRGTSLALALLFAAAVAVVVLSPRSPNARIAITSASAERVVGAAPVEEPAPPPSETPEPPSTDAETVAEVGDASVVDLPPGAPKTVAFGVVLVSYSGAQFAPDKARTKASAKQLAVELVELAKRDFAAAVKKGDRGSTTDAGAIPRGVLEPALERALFSLEKGAVHGEPLDTPRGYWIIRRTE